ncbi:MAG: hypothetical protein CMN73_16710 [Sphingomonas sp.]|nr:hypothetical protein [Sphingomonas sp.]|tara:strand:+ start:788 stop:967 length:180 start_codon:yes stop_codon:yes gene_type:complete
MAALGCLVPLFLLIAGLVVGGFVANGTGALWGAIIGALLGSAVPAVIFHSLIKARSNRK